MKYDLSVQCLKSVRIRSYSLVHIFPHSGRNNSGYGHFLRSGYIVALISGFICLILVFLFNFCSFKIIIFALHLLIFFNPRMINQCKHTNTDISSFQNGLKQPTLLRVFFKDFSKVWAHSTP